MTEYELDCARQAFERAMEVGAPGLSEVTRKAIAINATIKLRHQFNVPRPTRLTYDKAKQSIMAGDRPLNIKIEDTDLA